MSNNRTFFKKAQQGTMTLKDIFSDVMRKHTAEESARVLIAGTSLTTPDEADMLAGWQKPFLFARFGLSTMACIALFYFFQIFEKLFGLSGAGTYEAFLICIVIMVPTVMLLLTWEMNVPRTISLVDVLKTVAFGGGLSLVFSMIFFLYDNGEISNFAPIAEEPGKFLVVYLLLMRKNRKYILEGMLLGMAVGTGFAIVETFGYVMNTLNTAVFMYTSELTSSGISVSLGDVLQLSRPHAMSTAVLRAVNAVAGHGFMAALYSGGVMMAKGAEPIKPKHLLSKEFLGWFAVSCIMHGLNNSEFIDKKFPMFTIFGVKIWSYSFVQTAVALVLLLIMFRVGVNQVIQVTIAHHGGRVTKAVAGDGSGAPVASGSAAHSAAARLEFVAGDMAGQSFGLQAGKPVTVGRHPNCQICVNVFSVSSCHCTVALQGNMVVVTDQGSTNGTYVGKQRLMPQKETIVPDGTIVYLGNQNCAFRVRVQ